MYSATETMFNAPEVEDLERVAEMYRAQCAWLWQNGLSEDGSLMQMLTVGYKNHFSYLLHLADDYSRARVEELKPWPEKIEMHTQGCVSLIRILVLAHVERGTPCR